MSRTQVRLAWIDTASNEQGFRIERATGMRGFEVIATVGPDAQSYSDLAVKRCKTYTYRVVAFNAAGMSPYSNTLSVTIP